MSGRAANETAAHRYADASWPVFPLIPGEKAPITRHGFHNATTGHRQIQKWFRHFPDRNIGIATGAPGPDVLDVDRHPDGSGFGSYNRLRAHGLVPGAAALIRTPNDAAFDWDAARRLLQPERSPQQPGHPAGYPGQVEHLPDWVAQQQEGNRNAALFWAANRAIDRGRPDALGHLARAARSAGLDEREIDRTIRSAQRTAAQGAGFRQAEREAG